MQGSKRGPRRHIGLETSVREDDKIDNQNACGCVCLLLYVWESPSSVKTAAHVTCLLHN